MREARGIVVVAIAAALVGSCSGRGSGEEGASPSRDSTVTQVDSSATGGTGASIDGDSTSATAAADVVRAYYRAIQDRDFPRAYRQWGNDGASSRLSYARFAAGFESTARVEANVGEPGEIGAAAGSRYVEVPVTLHAVTRQGTDQWFRGRYVLRRSVVDGATSAQQRWHIDSATMTPVAGPNGGAADSARRGS
jgi:hypothetical protein